MMMTLRIKATMQKWKVSMWVKDKRADKKISRSMPGIEGEDQDKSEGVKKMNEKNHHSSHFSFTSQEIALQDYIWG